MSLLKTHQGSPERPRWDAFQELENLQQQLAKALQWPSVTDAPESDFIPLLDLEETDDAYLVELELPGVKKDDIQIELAGRRLVVTGERKEKERKGIVRRRSRLVGTFRHEILLPGDIDDNAVEASLSDGVLSIRVPKAAADRPRSITLK
jgi:HSP20 family protein